MTLLNTGNLSSQIRQTLKRKLLISLVCCFAFGISACLLIINTFYQTNSDTFELQSQILSENVKKTIMQTRAASQATTSLFESSQQVNYAEFSRFSSDMIEDLPFLYMMEYAPLVTSGQVGKLARFMAEQGFNSFQIRENIDGQWRVATPDKQYMPIAYMYPVLSDSEVLIGYDLLRDARLLPYLQRAMTQPDSIITPPYKLAEGPIAFFIIQYIRNDADPGIILTVVLSESIPLALREHIDTENMPSLRISYQAPHNPSRPSSDLNQAFPYLLDHTSKASDSAFLWPYVPYEKRISLLDHDIPYLLELNSAFALKAEQYQVLLIFLVVFVIFTYLTLWLVKNLTLKTGKLSMSEKSLLKQQERLEDTVQKRTAKLEAFAYSVSHDLRTPLRTINGFSQLLLGDKTLNLRAGSQEKLQRIINASQNMSQLIDGLLNFYRVSNIALVTQQLDLNKIAEESCLQLQFNEPTREVNFINHEVPTATGDSTLIRAVLDNLIGNAWKYTQPIEFSVIEFGSQLHEGNIAYYVKDNGIGFSMEHASKLFKPFNRLHEENEEIEGTGIGLAVVYEIIVRHQGRIWAKSSPGEGTTIYFTLHEAKK